MKLVGTNPSAAVEGMDELPGKSNYLIGRDPGKWRSASLGVSDNGGGSPQLVRVSGTGT
jgi:hypothetical protein